LPAGAGTRYGYTSPVLEGQVQLTPRKRDGRRKSAGTRGPIIGEVTDEIARGGFL
jgi:hypothetical protein